MKHLLPFVLLGLSGCAGGAVDHIWDPEYLTVESGDKTYLVRVQSDPLDFTYFNKVTNPTYDLTAQDREAVIRVVEEQVGAEICASGRMHLENFQTWRFPDDDPVLYLPSTGTYQLVTKCVY